LEELLHRHDPKTGTGFFGAKFCQRFARVWQRLKTAENGVIASFRSYLPFSKEKTRKSSK
jgi:hypothetical protein